jgi:hypothetical protein
MSKGLSQGVLWIFGEYLLRLPGRTPLERLRLRMAFMYHFDQFKDSRFQDPFLKKE